MPQAAPTSHVRQALHVVRGTSSSPSVRTFLPLVLTAMPQKIFFFLKTFFMKMRLEFPVPIPLSLAGWISSLKHFTCTRQGFNIWCKEMAIFRGERCTAVLASLDRVASPPKIRRDGSRADPCVILHGSLSRSMRKLFHSTSSPGHITMTGRQWQYSCTPFLYSAVPPHADHQRSSASIK